MILAALLLAAATASAGSPATTTPDLYRLELSGGQALWSKDRPQESGTLVLFHRYPDGILLSIRRSDVRRIVASKYQPKTAGAIAPGGLVELGPTGGGGGSSRTVGNASPTASKSVTSPRLGETKEGKALFNPDRDYRPDWDSKRVPGLNYPYPASPNDFREGRTLGYPSAPSVVAAPGDVPRARTETGEPPKPPNQ